MDVSEGSTVACLSFKSCLSLCYILRKTLMLPFVPLHVILHAWDFVSFIFCPKQGLKRGYCPTHIRLASLKFESTNQDSAGGKTLLS